MIENIAMCCVLLAGTVMSTHCRDMILHHNESAYQCIDSDAEDRE